MAALETSLGSKSLSEERTQETDTNGGSLGNSKGNDVQETLQGPNGDAVDILIKRNNVPDGSEKDGRALQGNEDLSKTSEGLEVKLEHVPNNLVMKGKGSVLIEVQTDGDDVYNEPSAVQHESLVSGGGGEAMTREKDAERCEIQENVYEIEEKNVFLINKPIAIIDNNASTQNEKQKIVASNAQGEFDGNTSLKQQGNFATNVSKTAQKVRKECVENRDDVNADEFVPLHARRAHSIRKSEISLTISENYRKYSQANIREQKIIKVPPNGGYGWVIVGAVGFIWMLVPSLQMCYGLVYADVQRDGGYTNAQMVGVATVAFALRNLLTPASNLLSEIWGSRPVTVLGVLALSFSLLLSTFTYTNVVAFYVFFGVLQGIGCSMTYPQLILVTQQYFTSKRVSALALSFTGVSLGNILMPLLVYHLIETYSVQGAFLIWSGVLLNSVAAALLLHPVQWYWKKQVSLVYDHQPTVNPEDEIRFQFRSQTAGMRMASFVDDEALARSCSFSSLTSRNSRTNVASRLRDAARRSNLPNGIAEEDCDFQCRTSACAEPERTTATQHTTLDSKEVPDSVPNENGLNRTVSRQSDEVASCSQSGMSECQKSVTSSVFELNSKFVKPSNTTRVRSVSEHEIPHSPVKFRISTQDSDEEDRNTDRNDTLSMSFLSTDGNKFNSTNHLRPPNLKVLKTPKDKQLTKWTDGFLELMISYKDILSNKMFILSCMSATCRRLVFMNYPAFLPLKAKEVDPAIKVVWLLPTVAISDAVVKILAAAVSAKFKIKTRYMYVCGALMTALSCLAAAVATHEAMLYASCLLLGAGMAVQTSTFSVLLLEAVGADLMTRGLGLQLFVTGIIALVIMPINGMLVDLTGSYRALYLVVFVCSLVPLLAWSLVYSLIKRCDKKRDDKLNVGFPD